MEKLYLLCRICLNENAQRVILKTQLQEVYEKLTSVPLQTTDMRPVSVCYMCYAQLNKSYKLMLRCLRADSILTQLLSQVLNSEDEEHQKAALIDKMCVNSTCFSISSTEMINIESEVLNDIKREEMACEQDVKTEDLKVQENTNEVHSDHDDGASSDPEDDIPLKNIIKDIKGIKKEKKIARVRKKEKTELNKGFKSDTREIKLTPEQQLENLLARSKSENYLNSPYKCEHCYKGFVNSKTYENHREKHEETSGAYSCDICRMRYSTKQQLKTHAVTSHERIYKCNCGHVSHTANQARVHEKWHNGYTYECQLCSHKFIKPTSYLSHVRKRHPTEHVCNICGESFVGKHGLQMHKTKTHRSNDTIENSEAAADSAADRFCTDCNIQFYSVDAWKRHILCSVKHTLKNENSTQCKICGWRILGTVSLVTHMKEHKKSLRQKRPPRVASGDTLRLHCQQCGANFVNRSKLQSHINRIHLGLKYNKNIVCEVCGKKCTSNATLKYHQRTHTGERPYACTTCAKQFPDSNQLRIHTRTHTGERPYVCTVCGKRFSQKPALNRHYRVHTGDKPYTCQYCSRTFSQSNSLKLHVRTVHLKLPANNRKNKRNVAEITVNTQNVDISQKDV